MPDGKEWEEIVRLRDWRHDIAAPEIASARGRIESLERRVKALERSVAEMVEADKIAAAVASAFQHRRGGLLTRWQRLGALAVALAAVVSTGLQLAHLFR